MRTIWALALLGLVMLVPLASAGDVASSEASGVLGVGAEDEDDQGEDLKSMAFPVNERQEEMALGAMYVVIAALLGGLIAFFLALALFYVFARK